MRPEYIFLRCPGCGHVYRSSAALCRQRIDELRSIVNAISATCPVCGMKTKIGETNVHFCKTDAA